MSDYKLSKQDKEILIYCSENIDYMWASKIVGIILKCDFRDSRSKLKKLGYYEENISDQ